MMAVPASIRGLQSTSFRGDTSSRYAITMTPAWVSTASISARPEVPVASRSAAARRGILRSPDGAILKKGLAVADLRDKDDDRLDGQLESWRRYRDGGRATHANSLPPDIRD